MVCGIFREGRRPDHRDSANQLPVRAVTDGFTHAIAFWSTAACFTHITGNVL